MSAAASTRSFVAPRRTTSRAVRAGAAASASEGDLTRGARQWRGSAASFTERDFARGRVADNSQGLTRDAPPRRQAATTAPAVRSHSVGVEDLGLDDFGRNRKNQVRTQAVATRSSAAALEDLVLDDFGGRRGLTARESGAGASCHDIKKLLTAARSKVRRFGPAAVSERTVTRALEAAHTTAGSEPVRFRWLGPAARAGVASAFVAAAVAKGKDPEGAADLFNALCAIPGCFYVTTAAPDAARSAAPEKVHAAAALAIHSLTLALAADGVSARWNAGAIAVSDAVAAACGADGAAERPVGLVFFGYPEEAEEVPRSIALDGFVTKTP